MEDERREEGGEVGRERKRPQKRDRNRITEKGYRLQELMDNTMAVMIWWRECITKCEEEENENGRALLLKGRGELEPPPTISS